MKVDDDGNLEGRGSILLGMQTILAINLSEDCSLMRAQTIVRLLGDFVIQIVRWVVENRF